jgi:hypothetical protein
MIPIGSKLLDHGLGHNQILPRHSYALEDGSAILAQRPVASDDVHHGDQIVAVQVALALCQNDVTRLTQCCSGILDNDVSAAHERAI